MDFGSCHVLEPAEASLQGAKSNELVAYPIVFAKAVIDQLAMQFLHTRCEIVLQFEIWKQRIQQIEFDPIISGIGPDLAGIGDFGTGDEFFYSVADIPHLIILIITADVHGSILYSILWCVHEGDERAGDVAAVD